MPNKWYQSRWLIGLVLRSIYEKHRKSSRQGGSSSESRGLCGGVMDEYSKCGEGARGDVLNDRRKVIQKHEQLGCKRSFRKQLSGVILKMALAGTVILEFRHVTKGDWINSLINIWSLR
ncbi:hypothetical protein PIB30_001350 [Stylosanthes scabra]|uniref:Uncharacterized protein n=1 Tax=Stylosanthes scabra TaxID=79078 RepID=A0ABU6XZH6_9FABA|nr:hypothetical protein [Stylosanthes scabra]